MISTSLQLCLRLRLCTHTIKRAHTHTMCTLCMWHRTDGRFASRHLFCIPIFMSAFPHAQVSIKNGVLIFFSSSSSSSSSFRSVRNCNERHKEVEWCGQLFRLRSSLGFKFMSQLLHVCVGLRVRFRFQFSSHTHSHCILFMCVVSIQRRCNQNSELQHTALLLNSGTRLAIHANCCSVSVVRLLLSC